MFHYFLRFVKTFRLRSQWRKKNKHNYTQLAGEVDAALVQAGRNTYGKIKAFTFNRNDRLKIGSFCSIAPEVCFIVSADHYLSHVSSYPFRSKLVDGGLEGVSKGDIVVDDDVWIGYGATILSGVHISQGAVIAAGAVVTRDVPPYAVAGGVPAKVISYRFDQNTIDYLLSLDYPALTDQMVREHIEELYTDITGMDTEKIRSLYQWFPKKKE